jgi:hypothetical protein
MRHVKTNVTPVITEATGTISKSYRKYLSNTGKARNQGTTETAILGHCTHTLETKGKGKAFPLQAWTGPWDSRRLKVQNF